MSFRVNFGFPEKRENIPLGILRHRRVEKNAQVARKFTHHTGKKSQCFFFNYVHNEKCAQAAEVRLKGEGKELLPSPFFSKMSVILK